MNDNNLTLHSIIKDTFRYDPSTGIVERRLRNGKWRAVGTKDSTGYLRVYVALGNGDKLLTNAHRIAWALSNNALPPPGYDIDHVNGVKDDNRLANLRLATRSQNLRNRQGAAANSSSQYVGVGWNEEKSTWQATVWNNRCVRLGLYTDEADAARAYNIATRHIAGEFASINNVTDPFRVPLMRSGKVSKNLQRIINDSTSTNRKAA